MWKMSRSHALWLFILLYKSLYWKKQQWLRRDWWETINVTVLKGYKKNSILKVDFISQSSYSIKGQSMRPLIAHFLVFFCARPLSLLLCDTNYKLELSAHSLFNIPQYSNPPYLNYSIRLKPRHRAFSVELLKDGEGPRQKRHFFQTAIVSCWLKPASRNSDNKLQKENLHSNVFIYCLLPRLSTRTFSAPSWPPWKQAHPRTGVWADVEWLRLRWIGFAHSAEKW